MGTEVRARVDSGAFHVPGQSTVSLTRIDDPSIGSNVTTEQLKGLDSLFEMCTNKGFPLLLTGSTALLATHDGIYAVGRSNDLCGLPRRPTQSLYFTTLPTATETFTDRLKPWLSAAALEHVACSAHDTDKMFETGFVSGFVYAGDRQRQKADCIFLGGAAIGRLLEYAAVLPPEQVGRNALRTASALLEKRVSVATEPDLFAQLILIKNKINLDFLIQRFLEEKGTPRMITSWREDFEKAVSVQIGSIDLFDLIKERITSAPILNPDYSSNPVITREVSHRKLVRLLQITRHTQVLESLMEHIKDSGKLVEAGNEESFVLEF